MKLSKIGLCYYPTTLLLLDDNKEFLKKCELTLSKHNPLLIYNSPEKALKFVNDEYQPKTFIDQCVASDGERNFDRFNQEINIRKINTIIYQIPSRFSEVAVLVVDYAMPEMNGLEFSRRIKKKHPFIKIIVLTGEAGYPLAVEAFNEGIIDKFIMKGKPDTIEIVLQSIEELQHKYFFHLSETYLASANQLHELECLTDPVFIELFNHVYKDNQIIEYYLMDDQGSFLLFNEEAKPSWLAVKTAKDLEGHWQHAEFEEASKSVIQKLKSGQYIPYFHTEQDLQTPPPQWEKYFHPAKQLKGKNTYYYSYITDSQAYNIQPDKIVSYQHYLRSK